MQILTDLKERYLNTDSNYSFGRYESNDIVLKSQSASRDHFEIRTGKLSPVERGDVNHITSLSVIIKSRAKTNINGEIYRLKKNDDAPIHLDFTSNLSNTISISKTAVDSRKDEREKAIVNITVKWVPMNILVADKRTFFSEKSLLDTVFKSKVDYRVTEDPFMASVYCIKEVLEDYKLWISVSRLIPVMDYNWLIRVLIDAEKLYGWMNNPTYEDFVSYAGSSKESNAYLPDKRRQDLFKNIVFLTNDIRGSLFKDWVQSLKGDTFDLHEYTSSNGSFSESAESVLRDKVIADRNKRYVIIKLQSDSISVEEQISINKSLADFAQKNGSSLFDEKEVFNSVKYCDVSQLKSLEPAGKRKPRRRYERINKFDLLDFSSQKASQNSKSPDKITSPTISSEALEYKTISGIDLRAPKNIETMADKTEGSNNHEHIAIKSVDDTSRNQRRNDSTILGKEDSETTEKNEEQNEFISATSHHDDSFPMSFVEAVKSTKSKAVESINNELGISTPSRNDINDKKNYIAAPSMTKNVETIHIPLRQKRNREGAVDTRYDDLNKPNFKRFKKIRGPVVSESITLTLNPSVNRHFKVNRNDSINDNSTERKLATDFSEEMENIKGYAVTLNASPLNDISQEKEVEDSLFVLEDSQSQNQQEEKGPVHTISTPEVISRASLVAEVNNDDDDDDDEEYDQLKFGFRKR